MSPVSQPRARFSRKSPNFFTDAATLALFDPAVLAHRIDDDADWWCGDFSLLDEVRSGQAIIAGLGGDGVYRFRVTDQDLTSCERDYAAEVIRSMGLYVRSGQVFAGPGECLPGGEHAPDDSDIARGSLMLVPSGHYLVDVYSINWFESPIWWRESGEAPDDAPPDFVIQLRPNESPYSGLQSVPRFAGRSGGYLFPSVTRRVGPEPGMILTTKVRKDPNGKLSVAECGPGSYRVALEDYSMVQWRQHVRFQVISVDHVARSMCAVSSRSQIDSGLFRFPPAATFPPDDCSAMFVFAASFAGEPIRSTARELKVCLNGAST